MTVNTVALWLKGLELDSREKAADEHVTVADLGDVETVAGNEQPILKEDFYNSLCAAFTVEEVRSQIKQAGLDLDVIQISDRHMLIRGLLP